jgi:hypothetical protein
MDMEKIWAVMTLPVDIILFSGLICAGVLLRIVWKYVKEKDKIISDKDAQITANAERTYAGVQTLERLATLIETLVNRGR